MLGAPESTAYDLRFRVFDMPVRVHPLFWLVMALISGQRDNLGLIVTFIAAAFVSVLVHECGHGLMARSFGDSPAILLYGMGGLCFTGERSHYPRRRLAVLACGPGAGFLLFGVTVIAGRLFFGIDPRDSLAAVGLGHRVGGGGGFPSRLVEEFYLYLLFINLWWGLLNLLPIWPLDGGQMTSVLLGMVSPAQGARWTHIVSLLTASLLAMWVFQRENLFMALWFIMFAMVNFQALQSMHATARYGNPSPDDADWWKR
jgi:Zn-dependent protease